MENFLFSAVFLLENSPGERDENTRRFNLVYEHCTKMKFFIKDFFSKRDQIR